jgi:phenylalanyl-tRNA synthetase alpha chain
MNNSTTIRTALSELETQLSEIFNTADLAAWDHLKVELLGKNGKITDLLKSLGKASPEERPVLGQQINALKDKLNHAFSLQKEKLTQAAWNQKLSEDKTDISLPSRKPRTGRFHPLNQTLKDAIECLTQLGFSLREGPDIETDFYNFEALNIPVDHPARAMHDTFYLESGHVLRTHTSPVQIRAMETEKPPIKIIVPGKVYRCDADPTHSPCFHQIEGLYVDKKVTFAELKGTLDHFLKAMFGQKRATRFRPSYFPFTEPSTEVDVQCFNCHGKGCSLCKHTGWLEILGAGMVHQNVFKSAGWDPDSVSGFAFGLGIERIAMLRYEIQDIRLFYENDYRFLEQF